MKLFLFFVLFTLTFSYGTKKHFNPADSKKIIREVKLLKKGRRVSQELVSHLGGHLKKSIEKKGLVESIKMCNIKALPLSEEIKDKFDLKNIKRVSDKNRNPENKMDSLDKIAMKYLKKENVPSYLQQKVTNGKISYRFYKKMKVKATCLNCHGKKENMPILVKNKISKIYPKDKAIGYSIDDFRGLIRIEFKEKKD